MLNIDLDREINPLIVADSITQFISGRLRDETISLYSAFLLNQDALRLGRRGYHQPAWRQQFNLRCALALYLQYLFAMAIGEANVAQTVAAWLAEDVPLLNTNRKHYIRKHFALLPVIETSNEQLAELSTIRSRYESLPSGDGPYHTEVFPWNEYSPEDVLLGRSSAKVEPGEIEPEVEVLMHRIFEWG